jgi:hypothetical protein
MSDTERRRYVPVIMGWDDNKFRVPVWVDDDEVTVSLGKDTYRRFHRDKMPSEIKAALSMVHAFPFDQTRPEWAINPINAYTPTDERQADIGWRVTQDLYILILSRDFLEDIYVRG